MCVRNVDQLLKESPNSELVVTYRYSAEGVLLEEEWSEASRCAALPTTDDPSATEWSGRFQWSGRELDVEPDLQYNRARSFDPTVGRWVCTDPLGFDSGESNFYRYCAPAGGKWLEPG